MDLKNIVPWGRSLAEYKAMFSLSETDLNKKILGCGDGPASFNAELTKLGGHVISIDPIYEFPALEIRKRIDETYQNVLEQVKKDPSPYVWTTFKTPEEMAETRLKTMGIFLADYQKGLPEKRYIRGELPSLPFANSSFDICISSHFLFLYSEKLDLDFHIQGIKEMLRTASEIRIFPLFDLKNQESPHVMPVKNYFQERRYSVELLKVPYEFQRGADTMMRISKA